MMKSFKKYSTIIAIGALAIAITPGDTGSARAGFSGSSFLGGMLASHVVGGFVRRDRARTQMEAQRTYRQPAPQPQYAAPQPQYAAPRPQYAAPPPRRAAAPAAKSVEQRIKELQTLSNQGLISKQEYQTRRKAILDSI